ncbi:MULTISPECIES: hypothetical protein [Nitrosomonas]|uniref:Uncharacterized protein n=1 Tax=Nitrosomonas communis TaxID=44574 RepID=A0A0F7KEU4_9PROT|nr:MULTISPECIES: hypothetical protein [Nitrosomonas]AKH37357.1 hypothetical protein AAW31_05320 [Nitrosomonas communis]TYP78304.1 hypothetical protein BCL69_107710 [Nitrosomonas communis]UVS62581.1 hypothetical protein NX761_05520 [Nitrosomonas sp. PLL12]
MRVYNQIIKFPERAMAAIIGGHPAADPVITEDVVIGAVDDSQNNREISSQLINKLFDNIII